MSPSDRSLAFLSLLNSRTICPMDARHLHSNVPWASQTCLDHFKLARFLLFSSTSIQRHARHLGTISAAPCSLLPCLPSSSPSPRQSIEWGDFPSGQRCLSLLPATYLSPLESITATTSKAIPLKICISPLL